MKRDITQIWVTKETRRVLKVLAAKVGMSVVEYLEEHFGTVILKGGENAQTEGTTRTPE